MPLSEQSQAWLEASGAALIALGTAAATIPAGIPDTPRTILAAILWAAGVVGIALSQAAGIKPASVKPA
jgi:hypothetical protein